MARDETQKAWDRFETDVKGLAGEFRRHYREVDDDKKRAELNRTLEHLKQTANSVFTSLENATRDVEVRSRSKRTAVSFGTALAETFRELGDELDKAIRKSRVTK